MGLNGGDGFEAVQGGFVEKISKLGLSGERAITELSEELQQYEDWGTS